MDFDLLIRHGRVVDGSGQPAYAADIGIARGRIAAIGELDNRATKVIDAEGHVVAPGFIDGHTHMDAQVNWDPLGTCSCWHGVTTAVMGNCGFTLAPAHSDERDLVLRNLERAEDIAPAAMAAGIDWAWETFPEYLDALDRLPMGINYAANIGHSALRTWAMGEKAFDGRASDDEIAVMRSELAAALQAGAIGFTTSVSESHRTPDGRPVASRMASWEEVCTLVGTIHDVGHGVFEIAVGGIVDDVPDDRFERVLDLAAKTRIPTTFGILGDAAAMRKMAQDMQRVVDGGGRIFGQSHSRGFRSMMSLESQLPFDSLPEWRDLRTLPIQAQLATLRDPGTRHRLVDAAKAGNYGGRLGAEPRQPNYSTMIVLQSPLPPNPTVAELAGQRRLEPLEVLIDLIIESDGKQFFAQPLGAFEDSSLRESLCNPLNVMTFSDSGAHVTQIVDASIQTYFLAYWVRARGALQLEDAVHKMTAMPAHVWGFSDRGLLREGMVADINVFDPLEIGPTMPSLARDLPSGAPRLIQKAKGILATVVAGKVLLQNGEHTGALPGHLLRAAHSN